MSAPSFADMTPEQQREFVRAIARELVRQRAAVRMLDVARRIVADVASRDAGGE